MDLVVISEVDILAILFESDKIFCFGTDQIDSYLMAMEYYMLVLYSSINYYYY
jgi:hypothetical protein